VRELGDSLRRPGPSLCHIRIAKTLCPVIAIVWRQGTAYSIPTIICIDHLTHREFEDILQLTEVRFGGQAHLLAAVPTRPSSAKGRIADEGDATAKRQPGHLITGGGTERGQDIRIGIHIT